MSDVSWAPIGVKNLLMHELGHSVGIYPFNEPQWTHPFYSSVMRYGQGRWGCDTTEWDSSASGVVKGTWHNQRKCGDSGWVHPLLDSNTNQRFFYCIRGGILDSSARDRWTGWNETLDDLVYSEGRLCNLDLKALNEKIGLAICYDRNHDSLVQPINGTPIDWNGNGVIDDGLVDIFTDTITSRKWLGSSWLDTDIPIVKAKRKESDVDEWKVLSEYSIPVFANIRNSHCGFLCGIIANDCKY